MSNILDKIKKAGLLGRGGASFPVYLKWQALKSEKKLKKYLVVNGSECEPGVYKDTYIIKNYSEELMRGIKLTSDFIKAQKIYFYLNKDFYQIKNKLNKIAKSIGLKTEIVFFLKPIDSGYVAGEETVILNIIEGQNIEPRLRPPFPTSQGLFGAPTLIHNIETLYNIYLLSQDKYQHKRFYSVNLANKNKGVYFLPDDLSIAEVLQQSNNYPKDDFFVQVGGDASGEVLNSQQLKRRVSGSASITVYKLKNHSPEKLLKYYLRFFKDNSCGLCTPCREGTFRLYEMLEKLGPAMRQEEGFKNILDSLSSSSLCALGSSVPIAIQTYFQNVYEPLIASKNLRTKNC